MREKIIIRAVTTLEDEGRLLEVFTRMQISAMQQFTDLLASRFICFREICPLLF